MVEKKKDQLINALRNAATSISVGSHYEWGHMGSCNCGHVAQQLTSFTREEIHRYAMEKHGDWSEQALDFCPQSGMTMDLLIGELTSKGLTTNDMIDLERLSNKEILRKVGVQGLNKNSKDNVVVYMNAWADLLQET